MNTHKSPSVPPLSMNEKKEKVKMFKVDSNKKPAHPKKYKSGFRKSVLKPYADFMATLNVGDSFVIEKENFMHSQMPQLRYIGYRIGIKIHTAHEITRNKEGNKVYIGRRIWRVE